MARENVSRGMRDEANVGPDPRRARSLRPMKELDRFVVADGEPDIRGWAVFTSTGREIGLVEDLLVDVDAGEVVMLDIDLKRNDRHTLAPVRAAWIDRASRRVVLDATELAPGDVDALPGLPRRGALSDQDVERFNDQYMAAYGDRGYDADREWELRHGDEDLRFGRRRSDPRDRAAADRELVSRNPSLGDTGLHTAAAAGGMAAAREHDERLEREQLERERLERERLAAARHEDERLRADRPRVERLPDERVRAEELEAARRREVRGDIRDDLRAEGVGYRGEPVFDESRRINDEMRAARGGLTDEAGIDPRELDARTRIDEGASVDADSPVGSVRYDSPAQAASHDYGRPDERYGPEYGSGRIGFDRVVSRHERVEADAAEVARRLDDATERRNVRYPSHLEDPADERRRRALEDLGRRSEERR